MQSLFFAYCTHLPQEGDSVKKNFKFQTNQQKENTISSIIIIDQWLIDKNYEIVSVQTEHALTSTL